MRRPAFVRQRRDPVGSELRLHFRFAQAQIARVNPASPRAEFETLFDAC